MVRWGLVLLLVMAASSAAAAERFAAQPEVLILSPESALVRFSATAPFSGRIEYGPYEAFSQSGALESSWSYALPEGEGVLSVEVELPGLLPGTRYAAQVVLVDGEAEERSAPLEFTLPPLPVATLLEPLPSLEPAVTPEEPPAPAALPTPDIAGAPCQTCPSWMTRLSEAPFAAPADAIVKASLLFLALFAVGLAIANSR